MYKKKLFKFWLSFLTLTSITVAAESSCFAAEPSQSQVQSAMDAVIDEAKAAEQNYSGGASITNSIVLNRVEKLGCAPARGRAGYICDIESDITWKGRRMTAVERYRLLKVKKNWVVMEKLP